MLLELARGRRVLFIGGKGGVGKTSVASALALECARRGMRVLLVSTDPAHSLGALWGLRLGDVPRALPGAGPGAIDAIEVDARATVDRHLAGVAAHMGRLLPEHLRGQARRHLDLAREAPGSHESALLERVAELMGSGTRSHDLVIFDTAPSGHTLRLLALPEQLGAWMDGLVRTRERSARLGAAARGLESRGAGGRGLGTRGNAAPRADGLGDILAQRRERFTRMSAALKDRGHTAVVIVSTEQELPVAESVDIAVRLRGLGIGVGAVVLNRCAPRGPAPAPVERLRRATPRVPILPVPRLEAEPVGGGLGTLADALAAARPLPRPRRGAPPRIGRASGTPQPPLSH